MVSPRSKKFRYYNWIPITGPKNSHIQIGLLPPIEEIFPDNLLDGFTKFVLYKDILPVMEQTDRKDFRRGKARQGVRLKQVPLPPAICQVR